MNRPEAEKYIQSIVDSMGEHFDVTQILCSRMLDDGSTESFFMGGGNYYARQGMAASFLKGDEARTMAREISANLEPPPSDDSELWKTGQ